MKKISSSGANGLLVKFIVKSVLFTIIALSFFSLLISFVFNKLDLDLKYLEYASYAVNTLTAIPVSYLCTKSFKNNGFLMGMLSTLPLIIYSFVNLIINGNNIIHFVIKLAVVLIISGIFGYFATKKQKKYKVK